MTAGVHRGLSTGRWHELSLVEQLGNVGSEVGRAMRAKEAGKGARARAAFERALELFDLTLADDRWRGRQREIARARELVVARFLGEAEPTDEALDRYFLQFATARHRNRTLTAGREADVLELDVERVRRYCRARIPAHLHDQIRLDVEVSGRRLTIVERRAPWTPEIGPEWTSMPIAQLRRDASAGTWALYWSDRNKVWHRDHVKPTAQLDRLLEHITADPEYHYWG